MDVDALMALANTAVEGTFGRSVTYTPVSGEPVVVLGDYQTSNLGKSFASAIEASGGVPRLDFHKATLVDAGISPTNRKGKTPGDVVAFLVGAEVHTYEVIDILPSAPNSIVLALGRRSE